MQTESLSDYLLLVAVVGGFVGTLFYFLRLEEKAIWLGLWLWARKKPKEATDKGALKRNYAMYSFNSIYLSEAKAKITASIYFFLSCIIGAWQITNIERLSEIQIWVKTALIFGGLLVLLIGCYGLYRLPGKIRILGLYYQWTHEFEVEDPYLRTLRELKQALEKGDWAEATVLKFRIDDFLPRVPPTRAFGAEQK